MNIQNKEQSELENVSTYAGLVKAINNFAEKLARQSLDMDEQVKNYNMIPSQKNEIVASTIENFVYTVIKVREKALKAQLAKETTS